MRASMFSLMLLAFALHSGACGDGGDGGDDVDSALEQALASMTDSQLAVMPLTAQEFGEAAGLLVSAGPAVAIDNSGAAQRSPPEDDTAADQERAGRINGYTRSYSTSGGGEGEARAIVWLDLYQGAAAASAAQAELADKMKGPEGQPVEGECDFAVDEAETFGVGGLPGEAAGLRLRPRSEPRTPGSGEAPSTRAQTTAVIFTYGPLLVTVAQLRCYDVDTASQVERAAQAQAERIEGVLRGEIVDAPEPTPHPVVTGPTGFEALVPDTEVKYLGGPGLRVEAVDFDRGRLDFALIGPYSGPLPPPDLKIGDDLEGVCQVMQVTSSAGKVEVSLSADEELAFTVEYACAAGRTVKFVQLFGFILEPL